MEPRQQGLLTVAVGLMSAALALILGTAVREPGGGAEVHQSIAILPLENLSGDACV